VPPESQDAGRREQVSLDSAATHILEECRMVLPGLEALFGFQLIVVFSEAFGDKLSFEEQLVHLHLVAIILVVLAIALVMAPAALHRQMHQQAVTQRFIRVASKLLLGFFVGKVIAASLAVGIVIALALLGLFILLWIVVPRRERARQPNTR
jgi:uncharacterized membrane protein YidH (DUF202 family)